MKSLLHPNRCRNGCSMFDDNRDGNPDYNIVGYCRAHGAHTAISFETEIFIKVRGCCTYGQCGAP